MKEEEVQEIHSGIVEKISSLISEPFYKDDDIDKKREELQEYIQSTFYSNRKSNSDYPEYYDEQQLLKNTLTKADELLDFWNSRGRENIDSEETKKTKKNKIHEIASMLTRIFRQTLSPKTIDEKEQSKSLYTEDETSESHVKPEPITYYEEGTNLNDASKENEPNITGLAQYIELSTNDYPNAPALRVSYDSDVVTGLKAENVNLKFDINLDKDFSSYMLGNDDFKKQTIADLNNHDGTLVFNSEESLHNYEAYLTSFKIEAKAKTTLNIKGALEKHPSQNELDYNLNPVAFLESLKKPQPVYQRDSLSEKSTNLPDSLDSNSEITEKQSNTRLKRKRETDKQEGGSKRKQTKKIP